MIFPINGHNLVSHYKIHIIPRFQNDQVKIDWGREKEDRGIAYRIEIANDIKSFLEYI
jgi:diadenosine tetraphosphate (Ap4A) HIT family hydrolase